MVWLTTSMLAISGAYRKSKQMPLKHITLFPKRYFHSLIKNCENLYIYDSSMNIWNIAIRHVWQLKLFKFCFLMQSWNIAHFGLHWLNSHTDYNASIYEGKRGGMKIHHPNLNEWSSTNESVLYEELLKIGLIFT